MDREFLEAIATEYQLSPEQRAAFVLRFDPAHLGESEAKLSSHLDIGVSTFVDYRNSGHEESDYSGKAGHYEN